MKNGYSIGNVSGRNIRFLFSHYIIMYRLKISVRLIRQTYEPDDK